MNITSLEEAIKRGNVLELATWRIHNPHSKQIGDHINHHKDEVATATCILIVLETAVATKADIYPFFKLVMRLIKPILALLLLLSEVSRDL